jgi:hypothetical protein
MPDQVNHTYCDMLQNVLPVMAGRICCQSWLAECAASHGWQNVLPVMAGSTFCSMSQYVWSIAYNCLGCILKPHLPVALRQAEAAASALLSGLPAASWEFESQAGLC